MPAATPLVIVSFVLVASVVVLGLGLGLGLGLESSSSSSGSGGSGGGSGGDDPPAPGETITTFTLANTGNTTSLGYKRIGLVFRDGDVPAGRRIRIQLQSGNDSTINVVPAQFDQRSYWPSGSLRLCTAAFRDSDFAVNETRTYAVVGEVGVFDKASGATLSDVTGASDFRVEFTNIQGNASGPISDLVASLNSHASVLTRVTKYESGKVCDSWMVWGMAGNHQHLKTIWYVTRWKNVNGGSVALEVAAVVAQDWWSVPGKEKLIYRATLKNGASTIETYDAVEHVYMMQWATVRLQDDDQHATRHWIGAAKPLLHYKPDRTYWIATGMVPPQNLTTPYKMASGYYVRDSYIPGSAFSHRPDIASTGGYMGRGILPNVDTIAFVTQTPADVRVMRVNNFAGLHIPAHRRSNRMRIRPGDAAPDVANTIVANILWDERSSSTPSSFYNFTADGMPMAVHAYTDSRTDAAFTDGYVRPSGGSVSGATAWSQTGDMAHAVAYSYYGYLYEGERYFLEATLDLGMNSIQALIGGPLGAMPAVAFYDSYNRRPIYPGTRPEQWAGIALKHVSAGTTRALGWALNLLAGMVIVPDDDVQANFVKQFLALNGKWLNVSTSAIPASGSGAWAPGGGSISPWMDVWIGMSAYTAYDRTGNRDWLSTAEYIAKGPIQWASNDRTGHAGSYRSIGRPAQLDNWNATSNDWFSDKIWFESLDGGSIDPSTDRIKLASVRFPCRDGDLVIASDNQQALNRVPVPSELTLGTRYFMINTINDTFQLARTPGGPAIDFASNYTGLSFGVLQQAAASPAGWSGFADSSQSMSRALVVLAKRHNHPLATQTVMDQYDAFDAKLDSTQWTTWHLSDRV